MTESACDDRPPAKDLANDGVAVDKVVLVVGVGQTLVANDAIELLLRLLEDVRVRGHGEDEGRDLIGGGVGSCGGDDVRGRLKEEANKYVPAPYMAPARKIASSSLRP